MIKAFSYILIFVALLSHEEAFSQKRSLITGAKAHVGNGKVINKSLIGIEGDEITLVKNALVTTIDSSRWDTIIPADNQHIYPGFIAPNSPLGLVEIGSVRATKDFNETGPFTPNARSIIAYNTDSRITPTIKTNGILMAQITPKGGKISGTSSVVKFGERNWDSSAIRMDDGVHLNWPNTFSKGGWWAKPGKNEKNKKYYRQVDTIHKFFKNAAAYCDIPKAEHSEKDLRYEAMRGLFNGSQNLYIHCDYVPQMNSVINLCKKFNIEQRVIVGGQESHLIAERLKENDFSVMIGKTHDLPSNADASIDEAYELPAILHKKGLPFCFENSGRMQAMNTRNLPFNSGTAIGYGLPEEAAVKAISLAPAKILGISDQYGSLEVGKKATLFVSDGNALEVLGNKVTIAFTDGKRLELNNHQKKLYKKYKEFYEEK